MAQQVKDLALSLTAAQVTGVAQVQSLAQKLPYATGVAIKTKEARSSRHDSVVNESD